MLLAVFGLVCFAARGLVLRRCDEAGTRRSGKSLLTGVAATFAFFVGFAISIGWGAVSAAQGMSSSGDGDPADGARVRNMPDQSQSRSLLDKLTAYAQTAADQDPQLLAQGVTVETPRLPLTPRRSRPRCIRIRTSSPGRATARMTTALTTLAGVLVATSPQWRIEALPQPLAALFLVGVLVSAAMGISTVTYGRRSMIFVGDLVSGARRCPHGRLGTGLPVRP